MLAMATWGCVTGIAMVESGLTPWQAIGMSGFGAICWLY
jgi:predicted branched-subunit amino acid permease